MKLKRRGLFILLSLMFVLAGTGCMKTASDTGIEEQALAYLKEKYDLSFEIE